MCLKNRQNNVTKVELDYQENHALYLYCRSHLKNAYWTWKLQFDFHDFIKFSAKRQLLLLLLPTTSATSPSNYDVKSSKWNNSLGELSIIIHWEISVNQCWKCNKSLISLYKYVWKVNKRTQELIKLDAYGAPNTKRKRQTNTIKQPKKNRWQA